MVEWLDRWSVPLVDLSPDVLEDAIGTGSLSGNVLVPSPEHLLVMKAAGELRMEGEGRPESRPFC